MGFVGKHNHIKGSRGAVNKALEVRIETVETLEGGRNG